jgi:hypothetical protein
VAQEWVKIGLPIASEKTKTAVDFSGVWRWETLIGSRSSCVMGKQVRRWFWIGKVDEFGVN